MRQRKPPWTNESVISRRLAAADSNAPAEAEADRRALLDAKGEDANHSETRVEMIDRRLREDPPQRPHDG